MRNNLLLKSNAILFFLLPLISAAQDFYICTSSGSKCFHKTERCAESRCSREIRCVTLSEAQQMHRTPCKKCLKGFFTHTNAVNKNNTTASIDSFRTEIAQTPQDRHSQLVQHSGYTASYNSTWLVSNWVAYELTPQKAVGTVKRPKIPCSPDPDVTGKSSEHSDYKNSGYCRGHLAPAMDMKWSEAAMNESFYMTNICPQTESLNNGKWKKIEEHLHGMAVGGCTLYICSGPIMPKTPQRIGQNKVSVPTHYFKVVCMKKKDQWYGIGFVLPNMNCKGSMYEYAMSIDDVEKITEIDFFYNLPDVIEKEIESNFKRKIWEI